MQGGGDAMKKRTRLFYAALLLPAVMLAGCSGSPSPADRTDQEQTAADMPQQQTGTEKHPGNRAGTGADFRQQPDGLYDNRHQFRRADGYLRSPGSRTSRRKYCGEN